MISRRFLRIIVLTTGLAALAPVPRTLDAQTATPAAATPVPASPATATRRVAVSKAVFGDAGVIMNARSDGYVEIAAAGTTKTVLLQLRTLAARAWADSMFRMMRARPRRSNTPRTFRADVQEHGSNNTMALVRTVTAGTSEYSLSVSDAPSGGFTVPIEESEAQVFVALVRKTVAESTKLLERANAPAGADSAADSVAKPAPKPRTKRPWKPAATPATSPGKPGATPPAASPAKPSPTSPAPAKP